MEQNQQYTTQNPLRVITLFSGYDSQCLALDRLKRAYPPFDYELVAWSDIDRHAITAHNALFPEAIGKNLGDVAKINWEEAPDCDLMTYSFPCTSISNVGKQMGLEEGSGTASSLLWECRKAVLAKHPRYLLMENVPALLQKKFMPYFQKWIDFLESEGYSNFYKVLNAVDYGVPQNRKRVFMVSIHDSNACYYFPKPFPLTRRLRDVLEDDVDEKFYLSEERLKNLVASNLKQKLSGNGFEFKPKRKDEVASTLTRSCATRRTDNYIICDDEEPAIKYIGNILEWEGTAKRKSPNAYRVYADNGVSPTLTASSGGGIIPHIIDE